MRKKKDIEYQIKADGVYVKSTKNQWFIIDVQDLDYIKKYGWHITKNGYVARNNDKRTLHRLLISPPKGYVIDHINRNKLDNRRKNLRIVDYSINNFNKASKLSNTNEKYIYSFRCYFKVEIGGKYYGCSKDIEKAKKIRDKAVIDSGVMKYNSDLQKNLVEH